MVFHVVVSQGAMDKISGKVGPVLHCRSGPVKQQRSGAARSVMDVDRHRGDLSRLSELISSYCPSEGQIFVLEGIKYRFVASAQTCGLERVVGEQTVEESSPAAVEAAVAEQNPANRDSLQLALRILFFFIVFTQNAGLLQVTVMAVAGLLIFLNQTGRLHFSLQRTPPLPLQKNPSISGSSSRRTTGRSLVQNLVSRLLDTISQFKVFLYTFFVSLIPNAFTVRN